MISRRAKRSGRPQESLRQFALNTTGGVDSTRPPTDFNTVYSANNLITNPDGSLSLRKPITVVEGTVRSAKIKQYYLYDKKHKLEVEGNKFRITDIKGNPKRLKITFTRPDGSEGSWSPKFSNNIDDLYVIQDIIIPQGDVSILNLNSTTVLSNCKIALSKLGTSDGQYSAIDSSLYDGDLKLPRYVQISYSSVNDRWILAIKMPEINEFDKVEGEAPLVNNLTLDNPYAIRDTYNQVLPSIRGIIAYAPSRLVDERPVLDDKAQLYLGHIGVLEGDSHIRDAGVSEVLTNTTYVNLNFPTTDPSKFAELSTYFEHSYTGCFRLYNRAITFSLEDLELPNNSKVHIHIAQRVHYSYVKESDTLETTVDFPEETYEYALFGADSQTKIMLEDVELIPEHYPKFATLEIVVSGYVFGDNSKLQVKSITESSKAVRYRPVANFKTGACTNAILKAFCDIPESKTEFYAMWFESTDYINWTSLHTVNSDRGIAVRELDTSWNPTFAEDKGGEEDEDNANSVLAYRTHRYFPLFGNSSNDDVAYATSDDNEATCSRIDVARATSINEPLTPRTFRFKLIAVEQISNADPEWDASGDDVQYRVKGTVGIQDYTPVFSYETTFMHVDIGNTVYGKKLYSNRVIYSYGYEKFFNNIFATDIDSFITPLYNVIDLDTHAAARVTCITPWRDYLVSATENAMYLHHKQSEGFYTKTVNASIGIPTEDANCCKSILNGVLFKSGPKVYQLYPNMYSGDDSTLNLTEISRAVEDYLEAYALSEHLPFAFSTASEYVLMLPNELDTTCLRYDFNARNWTVCTYPVVATSYEIISVDDIRIFGICEDYSAEFRFDSAVFSNKYSGKYGDELPNEMRPIEFEWDTGQKTDNIATAKQFVESKLMFSTEDSFEDFNVTLTVAVDGDPHVTTLDVNSDAPFWRTDTAVGALNTSLRLGDTAATGLFRQLIVRYSGKGRSVRHILSGKPTSNFRLYETYVRYKTLNVKR